MKALYLFIFLISLSFSKIKAQKRAPLGKYTISVQPLQLFVQDIPVCIERTFKRNTLGVSLAYRFKTHWDENTEMPYYNFNQHSEPVPASVSSYQALTFGLNAKHYTHNGYYLEGQLFYRYWWDNNRRYYPYTNKEIYTDVVNVVGLKCLLGHTSVLFQKGCTGIIINKYCGLSLREKFKGILPYSNFYNEQFGLKLGLQLGISLGVTTFPKNKLSDEQGSNN